MGPVLTARRAVEKEKRLSLGRAGHKPRIVSHTHMHKPSAPVGCNYFAITLLFALFQFTLGTVYIGGRMTRLLNI